MKAKKCISVFLCVAVLLSMTGTLRACAAHTETKVEPDQPNVLKDDAALLAEKFFEVEAVEIEEQDAIVSQVSSDLALLENTAFRYWVEPACVENGAITYKMSFEDTDLTDYLQVEKSDNGDVEIRIMEGKKEDLWIYKDNGQVYCNGVRMKDCELSFVSASNGGDVVSPQAGMYYTMRVAPMSYFNQNPGSIIDMFTTDYQNRYTLLKSTYISKVSLSGQIKSLTVSSVLNTLVSSVAAKLVSGIVSTPELAVGTALSGAVSVIKDVGTAVLLSYGSSSALSYKIHKFSYKKNNTIYAEYVYAIDSYAKEGFYGDNFVWGVLETGNAT